MSSVVIGPLPISRSTISCPYDTWYVVSVAFRHRAISERPKLISRFLVFLVLVNFLDDGRWRARLTPQVLERDVELQIDLRAQSFERAVCAMLEHDGSIKNT